MDNLTHTLVGAALAETGLKRATPLATPTLLIAVNFPDIDIIATAWGALVYLEHHRGITHSLLGILLLSALLATSVYGLSRWFRFRLTHDQERARFLPLLALSLLGVSTHPLLDYTNPYGLRPFLPWSHRWYYGDIAFVIDPWIWAGLGGAVFIATATTPQRVIVWIAAFAILTTLLLFAGTGLAIAAAWVAMIALAVVISFALKLTEERRRKLSLGALIALSLYLSSLALLHHLALEKAIAVAPSLTASEAPLRVSAMPMPAKAWLWRVVIETHSAFHFTNLHLLRESSSPVERYSRETGDPALIEAAKKTAAAQTFLRFARFPVIEVTQSGPQPEVSIRDMRFLDGNSFRINIKLTRHPEK